MKLSRAFQKGFRLLADPVVRRQALNAVDAYDRQMPEECSCCGFVGRFVSTGEDPVGSVCPSCRSLERHRLFALALRQGFVDVAGKDVLHCGPEASVWEMVEAAAPRSHRRIERHADRADGAGFVEHLELPSGSTDMVIAVHCLEHVDDVRALGEIHRVLRPSGRLIAMVPLVEGWAETYENSDVTSEVDREVHFGHAGHVRYYGADFRARLASAGFVVTEMTAGPEESGRYRLQRGEKVFVGTRP